MKNPGPISLGTEFHVAIHHFTKALSKRFDIAEPAALGQLVKLDECLRKAADSNYKMSSLVIKFEEPTEAVAEKK